MHTFLLVKFYKCNFSIYASYGNEVHSFSVSNKINRWQSIDVVAFSLFCRQHLLTFIIFMGPELNTGANQGYVEKISVIHL